MPDPSPQPDPTSFLPLSEVAWEILLALSAEERHGYAIIQEIAARTVNKERARAGESQESSRTSTDDISSGRRGGLRSGSGGGGRTKAQLYAEAKQKNVAGRSRMTKDELERAVGR